MIQAEQAFREGDLASARRLAQERIRKDPTAVAPRTFLVQLLAVLGEWERAKHQLSALAEIDRNSLPLAFTYGPALDAEMLRSRVTSGGEKPLVFGEPDPWVALLIEALARDSAGEALVAGNLRTAAFEQAPTTAGRIGGTKSTWIADADERLGPILEAVVNGKYLWIPFHRIRAIRIEPPEEIWDLVWIMAQFTWTNGGEAVGLIPARYPGTEALDDARLRLGRLTEWRSTGGGAEWPFGQRMLITPDAEHPLLDIREADFGTATDDDTRPAEAGSLIAEPDDA
jgi:type VI secretion system protein ImpE